MNGIRPTLAPTQASLPSLNFGRDAAQQAILQARMNPAYLQQLRLENPQLANFVENGNVDALAPLMEGTVPISVRRQAFEAHLNFHLNSSDASSGTKIEGLRRNLSNLDKEEQIVENKLLAYEYMPEAFTRMTMLYIPCKMNGISTFAFIDTGAAICVISEKVARESKLIELMDVKFAGVAKGVGTSKILGRIHMAQLQLGSEFFPISINVLDSISSWGLLIGLDFIRRHRCTLDFLEHSFNINSQKIKFLNDADVIKNIGEEETS